MYILYKYLFSYIHLNPIKLIDRDWKENGVKNYKKALTFLNTYRWSSYLDYRDYRRLENKIISKTEFPKYFKNKKVFEEEIFEWLAFKLLP